MCGDAATRVGMLAGGGRRAGSTVRSMHVGAFQVCSLPLAPLPSIPQTHSGVLLIPGCSLRCSGKWRTTPEDTSIFEDILFSA